MNANAVILPYTHEGKCFWLCSQQNSPICGHLSETMSDTGLNSASDHGDIFKKHMGRNMHRSAAAHISEAQVSYCKNNKL